MPYGLTIACGAVLAALLVGCFLARSAGSPVSLILRRALLFAAPLLLVSLLFSLQQYRVGGAVDSVRAGTTIGQLENAIAKVDMPLLLRQILRRTNATTAAAVLLLLGALLFVRSGRPCLGMGRRAAAGVGTGYVVVTVIAAGALMGQGAVRDIDTGIRRLQTHIGDIERKARDYQRDVEAAAREIVREALIQALDAASIQARLDAVRANLRAAREAIEPYRGLLQPGTGDFAGDTLESDFADTWQSIRETVNTLHWDRESVKPAVPDGSRSEWSALRLYEAGTGLRNDRLSRPRDEGGELHDVVAKTFDVVYAADGKSELDAAIDPGQEHPLAPLVGALVEVWHQPLKDLWTAQAGALFQATVTQRLPFADAAAVARAQVTEAMTPLKAHLKPGLDQVAQRLQRLEGEAARLPQSFRRHAEAAFPERLQTFRGTWQRLLGFSTPTAARAASALRLKTEEALEALSDPIRRHEQLAAYERALQPLALGVDDPARYQSLLRMEQQHVDSRDFARFTRDQLEAGPATLIATANGLPADGEALAQVESRSQWLETHRLAMDSLLDKGEGDWQPGDRERILSHLAFDLGFLIRAILENYKPESYTPNALRDRIRAYDRLAAALEPAALQGGEVVDTAFGNITGSSAKGALRFQIVDLIAAAEARLRLTQSGIPQKIAADTGQLRLAELLRAERNHIAIYQNASEDSYVKAVIGLWQEADRQPELGARLSAIVVAAIREDSRRLRAPAEGALRVLERLVQLSNDRALELTRLGRDLASREIPDAALYEAFTDSHERFLGLQEQIRQDWAEARRRLRIRGASHSR